MRLNKPKIKAFTLMELMIALAIAGILLGIAVPAFNTSMENSRLTSNANLMVGAFNYARNEAINRRAKVKVQQISGKNAWEVALDDGSELLKQFEPPGSGIEITASFSGGITYATSGYRELPATVQTIKICSANLDTGRLLTISVSGSVTVEQESC